MAFDKIKQLNQMRQQAKELQKQLQQVTHTEESGGIKIRVTGDQKIEYLEIDGEEAKKLLETINKAMKEVQKKAAKKMMEMGGGLSGLLGGN